MKKCRFLFFLVLYNAPWVAFAQNINKPKLDSLFDLLASKNKAMGSVSITRGGIAVYNKSIGYRFISENEKIIATENTEYRIGSISKMFTAVIIFQMMEEGKITLATMLDKYFPSLPNANKITISDLLSHRSGLHNITDDADYITWMTQAKTREQMLEIISKCKADFNPGKKFSYSNTNYIILGYIIEDISKQSYALQLHDRITSKIGISKTYSGGKTNIAGNESFSYHLLSKWEQDSVTDMSIPGGAGAIVSTPTDLTKFIEALFSLKLISQNSLNQMKTIKDGYGMGMLEVPFYEKKAFGHTGMIDGFASDLFYFPEDSLAVAYCSNGQVYPINDILIGILSIIYNKNYSLPEFRTYSINKSDLEKYTGVYSSAKTDLKITVSINDTTLIAQATGQPSFPLEPIEKDKFKFERAGVEMEFETEKNELKLTQGGGVYLFKKEKK